MAESVLVDQSQMNQGRASSLAAGYDVACSGGVFMMRSRHMSLSSYSSCVVVGGGTGFMTYGSSSHHLQQQQSPPLSVYGSLPASASFYSDQKLAHQPPLLPLPSGNKPAGLVVSSPRIRTNTGVKGELRSREHRAMKPMSFVNSAPRNAATAGSQTLEHPKTAETKTVIAPGKDDGAELALMESIYSLSPPPSNLPLPTFLLTRHKAAACIDQSVVKEGGSASGGC